MGLGLKFEGVGLCCAAVFLASVLLCFLGDEGWAGGFNAGCSRVAGRTQRPLSPVFLPGLFDGLSPRSKVPILEGSLQKRRARPLAASLS